MKPTQTLMNEHREIERVLAGFEIMCEELRAGRNVPPEILEACLELFQGYADVCHHKKEEDTLFPVLFTAGMTRDNSPIGILEEEHRRGRQLRASLRHLADNLDREPSTADQFASKGFAFIELLHDHIRKEDEIVFPLVDSRLSDQQQRELESVFSRVEQAIGVETARQYQQMIDRVEGWAQRKRETG